MRKLILSFILIIASLLFSTTADAKEGFSICTYNLDGIRQAYATVSIDAGGGYGKLKMDELRGAKIEVNDYILNYARENEHFMLVNPSPQNEDDTYEDTDRVIYVTVRCKTDRNHRPFGKDYRVIYFDEEFNPTDVSDKIRDRTDYTRVSLSVDKLGTYVIYYNPNIFDITFYSEDIYADKSILGNPDYIIKEITDVAPDATIYFPEIPEKVGYIFTGWKKYGGLTYTTRAGGSGGTVPEFAGPLPIEAEESGTYYATWCPEDEYEPIELKISSNKAITKGKENGKKITLETNYGVFADEEEMNSLPEYWSIIGSDEITIDTIERIDDKTIELTLSGKSEDIYKKSEIYIEFDSSLLLTEPYEDYGELYYPPHTKIKLDEVGVKAKMYRSDNSITLSRQHKQSSGSSGSSGNSMPAVIYNPGVQTTETVDNRIILTIGKKEASVFGEIKTNDVAPIIRNDRTMLPARFVAEAMGAVVEWDNNLRIITITKDDTEIVFTIDSETAMVNGETITLDSPALIENDRTYTPLRFIAENLGGTVEWGADSQTVTIKNYNCD